jgi:hypothetical protein
MVALSEATEMMLRDWMQGFIQDSLAHYEDIPDRVWVTHLHRYLGEHLEKIIEAEVESNEFPTVKSEAAFREEVTRLIHRILDEEIARSVARPRHLKPPHRSSD